MTPLFKKMGFNEPPFSKFSAEEEIDYLGEIFYEPKFFSTVFCDIGKNNTRYIFGERGSGKSALMFKLMGEIRKGGGLIVLIDDYTSILGKGNYLKVRYLRFLIKNALKTLIPDILIKNVDVNTVLNDTEKEKLRFLVNNFYSTVSITEIKKFQETHRIRDAASPIINGVLSGTVALTSDFISKSFGLPSQGGKFYREYIPTTKSNTEEIDFGVAKEEDLMTLLDDCADIVYKLGYKSLSFFFDKIDEEPEVAGSIDSVVRLLLPILINNKLLLNPKFSLAFFLWSKIKSELNSRGVRFDKIKPIDITWTQEELRKIIDKRVKYFSGGTVTYNGLFQSTDGADFLIRLSNKSPRDLLRALSSVYDQQDDMGTELSLLTNQAVSKGIYTFLSEYDFNSLYPTQKGTRQDIKSIISKLKKVDKTPFTVIELAAALKIGNQSGSSYVKIMKNYGVVAENQDIGGVKKNYDITDPKIKFILKNKIPLK